MKYNVFKYIDPVQGSSNTGFPPTPTHALCKCSRAWKCCYQPVLIFLRLDAKSNVLLHEANPICPNVFLLESLVLQATSYILWHIWTIIFWAKITLLAFLMSSYWVQRYTFVSSEGVRIAKCLHCSQREIVSFTWSRHLLSKHPGSRSGSRSRLRKRLCFRRRLCRWIASTTYACKQDSLRLKRGPQQMRYMSS